MRASAAFRNTFFQALILSIILHIVFSVFFSFRIPTNKSSAVPVVNFLGSFLGDYDTQPPEKNPPAIHRLGDKDSISILIPAKTSLPAGKMEPIKKKGIINTSKQTIPILSTITTDSEPAITKNNEAEFKHEPLNLNDYDRY